MRRLPLLLALVTLLSTLAPLGLGRAEDRYYTSAEDVRLGGRMRRVVTRIARQYHARTGRRLHLTSGTRTPRQQAAAMYDKVRLGVGLTRLYRNYQAASAIQRAYRDSRRTGRGRCIRAMARVIERQIREGTYISRHLQANAVDIRSRDMSRQQRRIFRAIVGEERGVRLLQEGRPPHFHLQL